MFKWQWWFVLKFFLWEISPRGALWYGIRATLVWTGAPSINVCQIEELTAAWSVHLRPGCRDHSLSLPIKSEALTQARPVFSDFYCFNHTFSLLAQQEDPIKTIMPVDCTDSDKVQMRAMKTSAHVRMSELKLMEAVNTIAAPDLSGWVNCRAAIFPWASLK